MSKQQGSTNSDDGKTEPQAVGTTQAAQILGLSITLVKNLVDQQELMAWKTPGGHRRIDMDSIRKYQNKLNKPIHFAPKPRTLPVISFMIDDSSVIKALKNNTSQWHKLIDFSIEKTISETYLAFSHKIPDILIIKAKMPIAQQIATVLELQSFIITMQKPMSVIFMTDTTALAMRFKEELNPAIQITTDTLDENWLKAFITGVMTALEWRN
jgi:excisionase family DNA binding protein